MLERYRSEVHLLQQETVNARAIRNQARQEQGQAQCIQVGTTPVPALPVSLCPTTQQLQHERPKSQLLFCHQLAMRSCDISIVEISLSSFMFYFPCPLSNLDSNGNPAQKRAKSKGFRIMASLASLSTVLPAISSPLKWDSWEDSIYKYM